MIKAVKVMLARFEVCAILFFSPKRIDLEAQGRVAHPGKTRVFDLPQRGCIDRERGV